MKVDLSRVLEDLEGNPAKDETGNALTLYRICSISLFAGIRDDKETDLSKLDKCWELKSKLSLAPIDLKVEDISFIKERIGKIYGTTPGVAGQARCMLDQEYKI